MWTWTEHPRFLEVVKEVWTAEGPKEELVKIQELPQEDPLKKDLVGKEILKANQAYLAFSDD